MHTLKNKNGMSVDIIERGAAVVSIKVKDKKEKFDDVIIGFDNPDDFKNNTVYFGVIAGRCANRIAKGKFQLNGKEYQLTINNPPNHLHGGINGLHSKIWHIEGKTTNSLKLSCTSPDGEDGYPGNIKVMVTYTVTDDDALKIEYEAVTDAPTILNLTNHCYFNLSADQESTILDHQLSIDADKFTSVDQNSIPTGKLTEVSNTPLDFRKSKMISSGIEDVYEQIKFAKGFDHNWVLNNYNGQVRKVASVYHAESGRELQVLTDQPGIQFYSGNYLDGIKGKKGVIYQKRSGLCLEAQLFPDAPNNTHFPSAVITPEKKYSQTTIYKFSTK
jgi:aldose 1-epimerase